jgi:TIR domain
MAAVIAQHGYQSKRSPSPLQLANYMEILHGPRRANMKLFISHSSKDREWVDLVRKRIEAAGFDAYLAEYDIAGIGHELNPKIHDAIKGTASG